MGSAINALATKVITRPNLLWEVPNSWSLAEAATVPTAYMTAYYALVMRGRLRSGMRVLIHSGTGAVGLAAVQICLHRGAEVGLLSFSRKAVPAAAEARVQPMHVVSMCPLEGCSTIRHLHRQSHDQHCTAACISQMREVQEVHTYLLQ